MPKCCLFIHKTFDMSSCSRWGSIRARRHQWLGLCLVFLLFIIRFFYLSQGRTVTNTGFFLCGRGSIIFHSFRIILWRGASLCGLRFDLLCSISHRRGILISLGCYKELISFILASEIHRLLSYRYGIIFYFSNWNLSPKNISTVVYERNPIIAINP